MVKIAVVTRLHYVVVNRSLDRVVIGFEKSVRGGALRVSVVCKVEGFRLDVIGEIDYVHAVIGHRDFVAPLTFGYRRARGGGKLGYPAVVPAASGSLTFTT